MAKLRWWLRAVMALSLLPLTLVAVLSAVALVPMIGEGPAFMAMLAWFFFLALLADALAEGFPRMSGR